MLESSIENPSKTEFWANSKLFIRKPRSVQCRKGEAAYQSPWYLDEGATRSVIIIGYRKARNPEPVFQSQNRLPKQELQNPE